MQELPVVCNDLSTSRVIVAQTWINRRRNLFQSGESIVLEELLFVFGG